MNATPNPAQSEFSKDSLPVKSLVEVLTTDPADLKNDRFPSGRPSFDRRSPLAFARFLILFCVGVAATLAWQSYGDAARQIIASSSPRLGWLAPQPAPPAQNAPDIIALAAPAAPSPDQQRLNAISLDLDAVRQSVDRIAASQEQTTRSVDRIAPSIVAGQEQMTRGIDRIAASQEQIARSVDRLTAGQEQMMREITKLQEIEQYILYKSSEPPLRPAPAPARSPAPRPSQAPTVR